MEKEIILFVRGEQTYDGVSPEVTELATEGVMTIREDGEMVLTYQESEITGMEGTTTRFTIRGGTVVLERAGLIVSRADLIDALWDSQIYIDDNTLSVNMTRLRAKLEGIGLPGFIKTRRGMGYQL